MTRPSDDLLVALLADRRSPDSLSPRDWELVLSQARRSRLAARLGAQLAQAGLGSPPVPEGAAQLLAAARMGARRAREQLQHEALGLAAGLRQLGQRCVLLKGMAYLCAGLPVAEDRLFGDIDLLVPESSLSAVEKGLLAYGWMASSRDEYDQRYYRQWMHELPPMTHLQRGTVLDVHHTITPPTSAFHVEGQRLLACAVPVDVERNLWVLQPVDMVLHSAVHLFTEGEFDRGLRDLLDLGGLLRHFEAHESGFWIDLLARADELGLQRPLYYALSQIERLFGPRVPEAQRAAVDAMRPPWPQRPLMSWLLEVVMRPDHPSCRVAGDGLARWLLFVRSHWLRMPLHLLIPHLVRKAWIGRFPPDKVKDAGRPPST